MNCNPHFISCFSFPKSFPPCLAGWWWYRRSFPSLLFPPWCEMAAGDAGNGKGQGFETQGSTSVVSQIRIEPITVVCHFASWIYKSAVVRGWVINALCSLYNLPANLNCKPLIYKPSFKPVIFSSVFTEAFQYVVSQRKRFPYPKRD